MTITETKLTTIGTKKAVEPNILNGEILKSTKRQGIST